MKKAEVKELYDELIKNLIQLTDTELSSVGINIKDIETTLIDQLDSAPKFQRKIDSGNIRKFNNSFHFEKKFFNLIILIHENLWLIFAKYFYYQEKKVNISSHNRSKMITFFSF